MFPAGTLVCENLNFFYGQRLVLRDVNAVFAGQRIHAVVGPSGCGKSTFLSIFNRLWQTQESGRLTGTVRLYQRGGDIDIYHPKTDVSALRRQIGMVFQTPNPLPMSIAANLAFPLRLRGDRLSKSQLAELVEAALAAVHLLKEVGDRLTDDARQLSGGQQQRLCLARALMTEPEVLLLDEPTASLDPLAAQKIEELLTELAQRCTILLVSHYHDQVQRLADTVYTIGEGRLQASIYR